MEIDTPAGPSTFRPTPALGVSYLLDVDEEDVKIIPVVPLPPIDDPNDEDYDPRGDQDIDDVDEEDDDDPEDSEEGPPYPTPSSIVRGKRKATEIYHVDEDEDLVPRQSGWLRGKKARLERDRKEPEYICISSDAEEGEDDVVEIPKPNPGKKVRREDLPPKLPVASSKEESEQDEERPEQSSASPDPDMGSVERIRPNTPNWLEVLLAKSRKQHPRANIELYYYYSIEGDIWQVKCNTCHKTCSVGPGESLSYFNKHLSGRSHQAAVGNLDPMPMPISSAAGAGAAAAKSSKNVSEARKTATTGTSRRDAPQAPRHTAGRDPAGGPSDGLGHGRGPYRQGREKAAGQNGGGGGGDDVERFLDQLGLSVDLAPKLRSFGFEDDRQMSLMGRLSDESLGLLLEHLTKQGVSLVTAIIVREGLKRRAGTL